MRVSQNTRRIIDDTRRDVARFKAELEQKVLSRLDELPGTKHQARQIRRAFPILDRFIGGV